jgi:hypothetical protein
VAKSEVRFEQGEERPKDDSPGDVEVEKSAEAEQSLQGKGSACSGRPGHGPVHPHGEEWVATSSAPPGPIRRRISARSARVERLCHATCERCIARRLAGAAVTHPNESGGSPIGSTRLEILAPPLPAPSLDSIVPRPSGRVGASACDLRRSPAAGAPPCSRPYCCRP